jgi:hypothetical protein
LAKAWPQCPPAALDEAVGRFADAITEHLQASAAFKLRDTIVDMMRTTADDLKALRNNPAALDALGARLEQLSRGTDAEQQEFKRLSDGLGPGSIDLAKANERAAQVGAALSVALPGLAHTAGHQALAAVAEEVAKQAGHAAVTEGVKLATNVALESACETAIQVGELLAHQPNAGGAGALSVTERLATFTGADALKRPARDRQQLDARLAAVMDAAGVSSGPARATAFALFLAKHGNELRGLDADAIGTRLEQFIVDSSSSPAP